MRVEIVDSDFRSEWDTYITTHPSAAFYHLWAWRLALVATYPGRPFYLAARRQDGTVAGVLPLFRVRTLTGKLRLISLPHAPLAGPLGDTPEVVTLLVTEATRLAKGHNSGLELRHAPPLTPDLQCTTQATYRLPLPNSTDALWNSLRPEIRNRTRKADKAGVVVTHGLDGLEDFYSVYARHMRDVGTPPHGKLFFSNLAKAAPNMLTLSVARLEGLAVAGMIRVSLGQIDTAVWVSSLAEFHAASPINSIYWQALQAAVNRQAKVFDFGRGLAGAGSTIFKQRYGALPHPLLRSCWPVHFSETNARTHFSRAWKLFPVWLSTHLGGRLRRFAP